ncbi:alpha beta hydrolase fold-3 domain protein [Botrytis cinerea]
MPIETLQADEHRFAIILGAGAAGIIQGYWSRTFAPQPEIQKYFEDVALQYELHKSTTFNTEIVEAKWDDSRLLWLVETTDLTTGDTKLWSCHVLIGALGAFTVPKKAPVKKCRCFQREEWHSVDWPKKCQSQGKDRCCNWNRTICLSIYSKHLP